MTLGGEKGVGIENYPLSLLPLEGGGLRWG